MRRILFDRAPVGKLKNQPDKAEDKAAGHARAARQSFRRCPACLK